MVSSDPAQVMHAGAQGSARTALALGRDDALRDEPLGRDAVLEARRLLLLQQPRDAAGRVEARAKVAELVRDARREARRELERALWHPLAVDVRRVLALHAVHALRARSCGRAGDASGGGGAAVAWLAHGEDALDVHELFRRRAARALPVVTVGAVAARTLPCLCANARSRDDRRHVGRSSGQASEQASARAGGQTAQSAATGRRGECRAKAKDSAEAAVLTPVRAGAVTDVRAREARGMEEASQRIVAGRLAAGDAVRVPLRAWW